MDRLADLESKRSAAEKEISLVREAIFAVLDREKASVLAGSKHDVRLGEEESLRFPQEGETGRRGLEMVLKEMGQFERFATLDSESLALALQDPEADPSLKAALEKFARPEKARRLRLVPRGTQQLDLFQ